MPDLTNSVPSDIGGELEELRSELDRQIPRKQLNRNLLIATWNLRAFGGLTKKWRSEEGDGPKRDLFALLYISEIISCFDVWLCRRSEGTWQPYDTRLNV